MTRRGVRMGGWVGRDGCAWVRRRTRSSALFTLASASRCARCSAAASAAATRAPAAAASPLAPSSAALASSHRARSASASRTASSATARISAITPLLCSSCSFSFAPHFPSFATAAAYFVLYSAYRSPSASNFDSRSWYSDETRATCFAGKNGGFGRLGRGL